MTDIIRLRRAILTDIVLLKKKISSIESELNFDLWRKGREGDEKKLRAEYLREMNINSYKKKLHTLQSIIK